MALEGTSAIIAVIAIIVGFILFSVFISIGAKITEKKRTKSQKEKKIPEETEPEFKAVGAVVLDKKAEMFSLGKHHTLEFKVAFMTDEGQTVEMDVSQEVYERLNVSQSGDLVTVNGNFFDFGDGEPIE